MARSSPSKINVYATSIFEDTLYRAWSDIIHDMVPDVKRLEKHLESFRRACEAVEVVLFERTTFLVIATATQKVKKKKKVQSDINIASGNELSHSANLDENKEDIFSKSHGIHEVVAVNEVGKPVEKQRYEKISTIIKQFRHSCRFFS